MRGSVVSAVASAVAYNSTATCARGVYLIVARGTSEPRGAGISGLLADRVAAKIKGSTVAPLDYPATLTEPEYDESVGDGVEALQRAVQGYTRSCPDSKVAIMGYSQGAQLTTDAICGGSGGAGFESAKPLPADLVEKNIVAVVLFGDPTHVVKTAYDRGTSVNNGIFERSNASVGVCETYSDRLVSYCDTGDVYCDSGNDRKVHGGYIQRYGGDALKFIVDRYGQGGGGGNRTSNSTGASTTSSTSAPTPLTGASTASSMTAPTSSAGAPTSSPTGSARTSGGSSAMAAVDGGIYLGLTLLVAAAMQAL